MFHKMNKVNYKEQIMTSKVGKQDYLGITIDYAREDNLNTFSVETLKDRYLWQDETHAQEAFARASVYGATYQEATDYDLAQRLYEYSQGLVWF
tara:strand:+ start:2710 stop:2991 length:282 start_codon:yes stop_codon:yes gene_type:complete